MAKLDELQAQLEEALGRIQSLEARNAELQAAPPPGGLGDALKELVAQLKGKDALAAEEHAKVKAANHAKRLATFEKTKKNETHVFYKTHAPAYLHGHEYPAGSIISMPLNKDEPEKHLPSIHWLPVVDKVVTTELVGVDEVEGGREADRDPAA